MVARSRRKKAAGEVPEYYCRKCMKYKTELNFYDATDRLLDANGKMSVCKQCIEEMYAGIYESERSVQKTILRLCQMLNVKYDPLAIEAAVNHAASQEKDTNKLFGLYKGKLLVMGRSSVTEGVKDLDLSYNFPNNITITDVEPLNDDAFEGAIELKKFWNTENSDDIEFLETNFSNFKQSHKADTYAEIVLLKEVCYKMLEIDKARRENNGKVNDSDLKQLMQIMEKLAISPHMANAAGSGKSQDCFGLWIKEIETMRPAEWAEDKSMFRDVDNAEEYAKTFIESPLRALVTGSREFSLEDGDVEYEEEE